jgi:primosomal protein DnaI
MKQAILEDPETRDIDVSIIHNLSTAHLYLQLKGIEKDGCLPQLKKDPYLEITYVPTKATIQKNKRTKYVNCFGEDSRDIEASIDKFRKNTPLRKNAYKLAKAIIDGELGYGIYIHSNDFQIGKTYLANAIVNALVDKGLHGSFLFTPSLARQAKEFNEIEQRIRYINDGEFLVIDDIGAEHKSSWFRSEVLMPLLQHRLAFKKLTIFTSNYSIEELTSLYGDSVDTRRLTTRILELAEVVKIDDSA